MTHSKIGAFLTIAAFSLAGCMSAQADFEDVQLTRKNLVFLGVPATLTEDIPSGASDTLRAEYSVANQGGDYALPPQSFTYSDAATHLPDGTQASLTLKSVILTARGQQRDLSFLHKVTLTVASPDVDDGRPRAIIDYTSASPTEGTNGTVTLPIVGSEITIDPWKMKSSVFELSLWGQLNQLPRESWAVDVTLTLSGDVEFKY